jgi:hypothetical protein
MMRGIPIGGIAVGMVLGLAFPSSAGRADAIQRAIDRGVDYLKQHQVIHEGQAQIGANALVGLTLLECGVQAKDPAVQREADRVRSGSPDLGHTYSLALSIMFLDRLGDSMDVPLIQLMTCRLLAGQNGEGGWSYHCPALTQADVNRLTTLLNQRNELRGGVDVPKAPTHKQAPARELPRDFQAQLQRLPRAGHGVREHGIRAGGDNSNTQFAILGLWVGHRHGVPVDTALELTERRFRQTQHADGGWGYTASLGATATMTCAGLLGLAMGYGCANEAVLRTDPDSKESKKVKTKKAAHDPGKDPAVRAGLQALGTTIGLPAAQTKLPVPVIPSGLGQRIYYFMWSLERVAVAYDLRTIGHKDWYAWGSEILLASQAADGTWQAEYGAPVDTCFALLFLRRANLARDLTASLKGKVNDPGEVTLKAGGVGGANVAGKGLAPALDLSTPNKDAKDQNSGTKLVPPASVVPAISATAPEQAAEAQAARLSADLLKAPAGQQEKLLQEFTSAKGVAYTQAIATAIPKLPANTQGKARDALAERLMRMTAATLRDRLKDDDPEMRVAAARACAGKDDRGHIPDLIGLLDDPEPRVVRAARTALKYLANGKDFGPDAEATPAQRTRAIDDWKKWWRDQKPR